eukprot:UN00579
MYKFDFRNTYQRTDKILQSLSAYSAFFALLQFRLTQLNYFSVHNRKSLSIRQRKILDIQCSSFLFQLIIDSILGP